MKDGRDIQSVEAQFEAERNRTVIEIEKPEPERKLTVPGLALLRMSSEKGRLKIEF